MEENGTIVTLDQEKVYDKIDHTYLLDTLNTFNLPNLFISTIESLYKNAHTAIMINGVLSCTYKETRGVRQGDPLSCLLFDLAIEHHKNCRNITCSNTVRYRRLTKIG